MMKLCGDISGLLRRGSPVRWYRSDGVHDGVCCFAPLRPAVLLVCHDPCREPGCPDPADVALDLSDPTGRFHAREWLRERGHDLGSEDRAEVLAWSVLSVHRGGWPLRGAAGAWDRKWQRSGICHRPMPLHHYATVACNRWWISAFGSRIAEMHYPDFRDGCSDCDARLLALGWALTNADGSLTLPPLPEVHNG